MPKAHLLVPTELVQAIGAYLIQRPYVEVHGFIAALQQCQPGQMEPSPTPDAGDDRNRH